MKYYNCENGELYYGDVLNEMANIPDKSINCIITSPPYWMLRNYGYNEQWGLEKTYQEYLEHLRLFMKECWRVLRDDGSAWINLGDTYMNNSSYSEKGRQGFGNDKKGMLNKKDITIKQKSLCLIPYRFAINCIDDEWILRNNIVWASLNKMPESVTDRFSKKH